MKVARVWVGKDIELNTDQDEKTKKMLPIEPLKIFTKIHWDMLQASIACNVPNEYGATDKGMVDLLERGGVDMHDLQKRHKTTDKDEDIIRFPFSSSRKRMSTVIQNASEAGIPEGAERTPAQESYNKRLMIKGASELILEKCTKYMDENGKVQRLDDQVREQVLTNITFYAKKALRTIALAYRELEPGLHGDKHDQPDDGEIKDVEVNDLTLISIMGIYDIIRSEVPKAVETCQKAGVTVRMITGDNIITAQAIAEKCGIIQEHEMDDPQVCMEGPEFYTAMGGLIEVNGRERVRNFQQFKNLMGRMKVMARSRPEDKYLLVTGLMNMRNVVAVTGDGTNDAPALSKADVGFGMGVTGTQVCKAAADIIIQDDSFTSVVKACSWGRNIYDNIKRFLQFQLTVNVNAMLFTVVGAILLKESPLQAIQLLWVNMIMDSLASLALATELPRPELLERPPQVRDDFVVSRKMTKHILYMSLFQMVVLFIFLFGGEYMIMEPKEELRYNLLRKDAGYDDWEDNTFVFPGRLYELNGDELYKKYKELPEIDEADSRHMTFIFNLFIWLQIINMIAARKIHDEINICDGFFANPMFLIIWVVIVGVNFLIIQYTGEFFSLHPDGLSWEQHLLCIGVSISVLVVNIILKLLPDDVAPKLGKDSVDERRLEAKKGAVRANDDIEMNQLTNSVH